MTPANAITLPWPDSRLSPNARVHWARKAKASKDARRLAYCSAMAAFGSTAPPPVDDCIALNLWLDFYPPDRRRRDDDNLLSMFKPYRDGLADYLRIDDSRFVSHPRLMPYTPTRKGRTLAYFTTNPSPP